MVLERNHFLAMPQTYQITNTEMVLIEYERNKHYKHKEFGGGYIK